MIREVGYSWLIRPILYVLDLLIISLLAYFFLTNNIFYIACFVAFWFILSISFSFYEVYRFTKVIKIVSLLFKQIILFTLAILAFLFLIKSDITSKTILKFFLLIFFILNFWRIFLFFLFRRYRIITGSNYKRVIIIGSNNSTEKLQAFFDRPGYGYKFKGYFTDANDVNKIKVHTRQ